MIDRALRRLICYIDSTSNYALRGFVHECMEDVKLHLYADADFAGDSADPTPVSRWETAVAHSTPEAEIISANTAVRTIGIPALAMWESIPR